MSGQFMALDREMSPEIRKTAWNEKDLESAKTAIEDGMSKRPKCPESGSSLGLAFGGPKKNQVDFAVPGPSNQNLVAEQIKLLLVWP
ncbi:hypothetical protein JTB14_002234 [Gonioctena quinquepunctata]|nr:hypothetical protein JTB14_002234 [Gonioctena quinquepunctata]